MEKWDITGTWIGEYSYDPNSAFPALKRSIGFTFHARLGWFGRFRGTIQDDPVCGVFEAAATVGRVRGTSLEFRKQYPHFYVFYDDKLVTLAEQLKATDGITLDEAPSPEPIWYRGQYDQENQIATGTWRIKGGRIGLMAHGELFEIMACAVTGSWSMRRHSI